MWETLDYDRIIFTPIVCFIKSERDDNLFYKIRAIPRDLAHEQLPQTYKRRILDFIYGTGIYEDNVNTWLILENKERKTFSNLNASIIDKKTIGIYSGLNDINGQEIYRNDIVSLNGCKYDNARVEYFDGAFELRINNNDVAWRLTSRLIQEHGIKVIGNIFNNPEIKF